AKQSRFVLETGWTKRDEDAVLRFGPRDDGITAIDARRGRSAVLCAIRIALEARHQRGESRDGSFLAHRVLDPEDLRPGLVRRRKIHDARDDEEARIRETLTEELREARCSSPRRIAARERE